MRYSELILNQLQRNQFDINYHLTFNLQFHLVDITSKDTIQHERVIQSKMLSIAHSCVKNRGCVVDSRQVYGRIEKSTNNREKDAFLQYYMQDDEPKNTEESDAEQKTVATNDSQQQNQLQIPSETPTTLSSQIPEQQNHTQPVARRLYIVSTAQAPIVRRRRCFRKPKSMLKMVLNAQWVESSFFEESEIALLKRQLIFHCLRNQRLAYLEAAQPNPLPRKITRSQN